MVFTFARVGAAIGMKVEDYFSNRMARRPLSQIDEKDGLSDLLPGNIHHRLHSCSSWTKVLFN